LSSLDQRFFSVTPTLAECMFKKTVSRSGLVVMALTEEKDSFLSETLEHHYNPFAA
jgi:hypothetical protein